MRGSSAAVWEALSKDRCRESMGPYLSVAVETDVSGQMESMSTSSLPVVLGWLSRWST